MQSVLRQKPISRCLVSMAFDVIYCKNHTKESRFFCVLMCIAAFEIAFCHHNELKKDNELNNSIINSIITRSKHNMEYKLQ